MHMYLRLYLHISEETTSWKVRHGNILNDNLPETTTMGEPGSIGVYVICNTIHDFSERIVVEETKGNVV